MSQHTYINHYKDGNIEQDPAVELETFETVHMHRSKLCNRFHIAGETSVLEVPLCSQSWSFLRALEDSRR